MSEKKISLTGGVLSETGTYYLLMASGDADEGESVIVAGIATEGKVPVAPVTQPAEWVSIIALPEAWADLGEAAAITAEGEVRFLLRDIAVTEIIEGAGYSGKGALGLGRMIALRECSGTLFALGFGGQVYRRHVDSPWEALGPVTAVGANRPAFNSVASGPRVGSFVFGGVNISEFNTNDAIKAADSAGDAMLLADLILDSLGDDTPALRLFEADWSTELFDGDGILGPIFKMPSSSWSLFTSSGTILSSSDLVFFEEVYAPPRPRPWDDAKIWNNQLIVLAGNEIQILSGDSLESFPVQLPETKGQSLSLSPVSQGLAVIQSDAVVYFNRSTWEKLVPTLI